MNRARKFVLVLGSLALIYLLAQFYFFYSCPIGVMCSGNKSELTTRMIIVIVATGLAYWLLKPGNTSRQPDNAKQSTDESTVGSTTLTQTTTASNTEGEVNNTVEQSPEASSTNSEKSMAPATDSKTFKE